MIPYTAADYKKYVHAKSVHRIGRINEIIEALDSAHGLPRLPAQALVSPLRVWAWTVAGG